MFSGSIAGVSQHVEHHRDAKTQRREGLVERPWAGLAAEKRCTASAANRLSLAGSAGAARGPLEEGGGRVLVGNLQFPPQPFELGTRDHRRRRTRGWGGRLTRLALCLRRANRRATRRWSTRGPTPPAAVAKSSASTWVRSLANRCEKRVIRGFYRSRGQCKPRRPLQGNLPANARAVMICCWGKGIARRQSGRNKGVDAAAEWNGPPQLSGRIARTAYSQYAGRRRRLAKQAALLQEIHGSEKRPFFKAK